MEGAARSAVSSDFWKSLATDLENYKKGVINELLKHSDDIGLDNEKRAMVFAFEKVLEYPHRLIENGRRARQALDEATKQAQLKQEDSMAQAVETLGYHQVFD